MESIIKFIKNKDYTSDIPFSDFKKKMKSIIKTKSKKMAKHLSYDKKEKIVVKSINKKDIKTLSKPKSKTKTLSKSKSKKSKYIP